MVVVAVKLEPSLYVVMMLTSADVEKGIKKPVTSVQMVVLVRGPAQPETPLEGNI